MGGRLPRKIVRADTTDLDRRFERLVLCVKPDFLHPSIESVQTGHTGGKNQYGAEEHAAAHRQKEKERARQQQPERRTDTRKRQARTVNLSDLMCRKVFLNDKEQHKVTHRSTECGERGPSKRHRNGRGKRQEREAQTYD